MKNLIVFILLLASTSLCAQNAKIIITGNGGSSSERFGVSGEDAIAGQSRGFNLLTNDFAITGGQGSTYSIDLTQTDGTVVRVNLEPNSGLNLVSETAGGVLSSQIQVMPNQLNLINIGGGAVHVLNEFGGNQRFVSSNTGNTFVPISVNGEVADSDGNITLAVSSDSTLQQIFDNDPTASPTINAHGNSFFLDSVPSFHIDYRGKPESHGFLYLDDVGTQIGGSSDSVISIVYAGQPNLDSVTVAQLESTSFKVGQTGTHNLIVRPYTVTVGNGSSFGGGTSFLIVNADTLLSPPTYIWAADGDTLKKVAYPAGGSQTFQQTLIVGSVLTQDNTITGGDNDLIISNDRTGGLTAFEIRNNGGSGNGLVIQTGAGTNAGLTVGYGGTTWGAQITASSGTALNLDGGVSGAFISSDDGLPLEVRDNSLANNNAVKPIVSIKRISNVNAANGIGASLLFSIDAATTIANPFESNSIISEWTDATEASRTSQFSITGVFNATTNVLLTISGEGVFTLVQGLADYANNAAAISGGLTAGQLYRNGDAVSIVH